MTLVNPFTRARRAHYDQLRAGIAEVIATAQTEARELTPEETEQIRAAGAEAQTLHAELTDMAAEDERQAAAAAMAVRVQGGDPGVNLGNGAVDDYAAAGGDDPVPSLMPSRSQLVEMVRTIAEGGSNRRWTVDQAAAVQVRATLTTAQVGLGSSAAAGAVLREPRWISTAVALPVERVQGVEGLTFPVFGAGIADVDTEATLKQEYSAVTAGSATPLVIAVWTDFTRQASLSMPSFEARLRGKHAALVAKREDVLMVARLNAAAGTQAYVGTTGTTPAYSDSLLAACGLVLASDVAAAPDIILVNPADLPRIFPADTTHGLNGSAPDSAMRLELHGAIVYPTAAVSAGTAIVAALAASARFVVGLAPTVLVDAMTGLKNNIITSLMEEAVTLAVDEPTGVVLVDLIPPAA